MLGDRRTKSAAAAAAALVAASLALPVAADAHAGHPGNAGHGHGDYRVTLLSDDNFGDTQTTRFLTLDARLP